MKERFVQRPIRDEKNVEYLADKGFPRAIAISLDARGICQANFAQYFQEQSVFHDAFLMPNMQEVVETVQMVMDSGGSILICGDYDADGLTASSILSLFFSDNGVDNDVLIPSREEGYGLHADKVIRAFSRKYYDLVITVDCGISNLEEVDKIIQELGVEVIVTDHHELPEVLPNCLCINPKMGYPFANLAGAGVAWKLVEALAGREVAQKYSLLAAIGTIGDIMPMEDENRSIVKMGLQNLNHKNLLKLVESLGCKGNLTATDIAMKISPRINAAGRVGHPDVALDFLLCRDKVDTKCLEKLNQLNEERKTMLNDIVADADTMIDAKVVEREKMVFLYSNYWQHGVLGIVAARYKEAFGVPAIVMTRDGDNYVGSARGVEGIDLFESFCQCKHLLAKFGGHKASVGFSVSVENLQELRSALAKVYNTYPQSSFEKVSYYDLMLDESTTVNDVFQLSQALQPMLPQDKFVVRVKDFVKFANAFGKNKEHLSATLNGGLEVKGFFNYGKYAPFLKGGANVDCLCTLDLDSYTKNICGILEDIAVCNSVCFDDLYKQNLLKNFQPFQGQWSSFADGVGLLQQSSVLAVFDDYETYLEVAKTVDLGNFAVDIFLPNSTSRQVVVVSPVEAYPFEKFNHVVAFCGNDKVVRNFGQNCCYVKVQPKNQTLYHLLLTREICAQVFSALKHKSRFDSFKNLFDKVLQNKMSYHQFAVAIRVFQQLGLVKIVDQYTVEFPETAKTNLENSSIYNCFAQAKL